MFNFETYRAASPDLRRETTKLFSIFHRNRDNSEPPLHILSASSRAPILPVGAESHLSYAVPHI